MPPTVVHIRDRGGLYSRTKGAKRIVAVEVTGLPVRAVAVPAPTRENRAGELTGGCPEDVFQALLVDDAALPLPRPSPLPPPPRPPHTGLIDILAAVRARLGHRSSAAPQPSLQPRPPPPTSTVWHKDRAKARGGDHPWSAGQQDQGQPIDRGAASVVTAARGSRAGRPPFSRRSRHLTLQAHSANHARRGPLCDEQDHPNCEPCPRPDSGMPGWPQCTLSAQWSDTLDSSVRTRSTELEHYADHSNPHSARTTARHLRGEWHGATASPLGRRRGPS